MSFHKGIFISSDLQKIQIPPPPFQPLKPLSPAKANGWDKKHYKMHPKC